MRDIFNGLEPIELPHEFEIELDFFILHNYTLTLRAIEQREEEAYAETQEALNDDRETMDHADDQIERFYEQLRVAAVHLALVSLVIRLEHWVNKFKRVVPDVPKERPPKKRKSKLAGKLDVLNHYLGGDPVGVDFFDDLAMARNSVVHGDSKKCWSKQYANDSGELKFAEDNLREAVERAKKQVKWYDEKLYESRRKTAGTS